MSPEHFTRLTIPAPIGAVLSEGMVLGTEVTCPWHGAVFDVTTGSVLGPLRRKTSPAITSESKAGTFKSNSKKV